MQQRVVYFPCPSCCIQTEDYFYYHGIENALCGKTFENGEQFTPERIIVIQME